MSTTHRISIAFRGNVGRGCTASHFHFAFPFIGYDHTVSPPVVPVHAGRKQILYGEGEEKRLANGPAVLSCSLVSAISILSINLIHFAIRGPRLLAHHKLNQTVRCVREPRASCTETGDWQHGVLAGAGTSGAWEGAWILPSNLFRSV